MLHPDRGGARMPAPRYRINLFSFDKDETWIADVPDLGSASAHGESAAEAPRDVDIAITTAPIAPMPSDFFVCIYQPRWDATSQSETRHRGLRRQEPAARGTATLHPTAARAR